MPLIRTSDGVDLHVTDTGRDTGASQGRTIVLVAGFTAPTTSWALTEDALTDAGHRVVCVDRRSHGRSQSPAFGQRMARHGQDLHEVLNRLDLNDTIVVGASMGASTIWAMLDLSGPQNPRRVAGVVSVDQTPRMRNGGDWQHGYYGFDDANAGTFFAEGIPATGMGRPQEASTEAFNRLVDRVHGDLPGFGQIRPETMPLLRDHAQQDWRDVIARTAVPVLMVAGRQSQLWPCKHAEATAALAPQGRAAVIEECGHAVNIDQPEPFHALLLDFVAKV